jgi:photosystem II stability/assembly factor-like uncharacterized protein
MVKPEMSPSVDDCAVESLQRRIVGPGVAVLLCTLLSMASALAAEWQWQHPLPQGNTLWNAAFADAYNGFAVGDDGTILATRDGGETWLLQYEGVTDNLRDIEVLDPQTAWIVGDNGMILHTTNGGFQWLEQTSGTINGLNTVLFRDRMNGWAGGDGKTIVRTTDGGATWMQAVLPTGQGNPGINGIDFTSTTDGWATGSGSMMGSTGGSLYRSTDGGATWTYVQALSASGLDIAFVSGGSSGFITGSGGLILSTSNGGSSWSSVASGTTRGLNDIHFASSTEFWIAGDNATLLHSTSAGAQWVSEPFQGTYASVNGIAQAGTTLLAVGEFGFMARREAGSAWNILQSGSFPAVNWCAFSDPMNGIAVGQWGLIMRTNDGGATWERVDNGLTGDSFYGAACAGTRIWVVGDLGVLLHSSDRGTTWLQQSTYTTLTLLSVSFTDELHGWAVGDNGVLLRTTDGGANWTQGTSGATTPLYGVDMKSGTQGWTVGEYGAIRHTADGSSWAPQTSPVSTVLWSTSFITEHHGYAAGGSGVLLRTTDGGGTWTPGLTGTMRNVYAAGGATVSQARAIGDTGLVLFSADGGATWSPEFAKTTYDLYTLHVVSDTVAWAGGDNGTILRKGTPRIEPTGLAVAPAMEMPESAALDQNYPNPFNPSTTIRYTVASPAQVSLTVFTVLGQEVATLHDGWREAGVYEATFTAQHTLGSGVLFYRLNVNGAVLVRAAVLMR